MDLLLLILLALSIIAIFFLLLLIFGRPKKATTTPRVRRKFPVKTIIVIVIILSIFFLSPGDTSDKIEKAKSVIPRKAPEIPVFADNFSRQELGENWRLGTNNWAIENNELVGQKGNKEKAWIHLNKNIEADKITITFDAWIESKEWKPKTEIGVYICDESSESKYHPVLIFDGEAHICPEYNSGFRAFKPFSNPLKANKVYRITAKRIEQRKEVQLSLIVTDENGKIIGTDSKTIEKKGKERIKIGFFSFNFEKSSVSYENNKDRVHFDNLKIYAYAT
jgi:hypothetical protein